MLVFPPLFLWLFLVFLYPLSSYLDQPSFFACYPHHLPPIPFFIYALPSLHHVILHNHMCVFFFLFNLFTRLSFGQLCVLFGFFFWVILSYLSSLGFRLAFMMGKPHGKDILQEPEMTSPQAISRLFKVQKLSISKRSTSNSSIPLRISGESTSNFL